MEANNKAGKPIDLKQAIKLTKEFRDKNPKATKAEFYSLDELNSLLNGAAGLRIYYGADNGQSKLVLVGVDKDGRDLLPAAEGTTGQAVPAVGSKLLSDGQPCPTVCDPNSPLSN
ncbi:hypothetical protein GCM10023187_26600 [Nibrella viscosa]|uniref:Uncharacterized protein n=1 Tax=Nibrella viscosa TaxID=1084524 RepID=A0ABP8KGN8_9BACT